MIILSLLALACALPATYAWLPNDGSTKLVNTDGHSLFEGNGTSNTSGVTPRWWTSSGKIRGVNLGSVFVYEPWIDSGEWNKMGCGAYKSEFDCVSKLGQAKSDTAFQKHWDTWFTAADLDEMLSYGINTIRIPLGYWLDESLVDKSEHFPKVRSPSPSLSERYRRKQCLTCIGCSDVLDPALRLG